MAQMSGISIDSLRYYDKLGILSPKRGENGYRCYDEQDYIFLQYIVVMKYAHFSLGEIKHIIRSFGIERSEDCNRLNYILLEGNRNKLSQMIKNYRKIIKLIDNILPMVDGMDTYYGNEREVELLIHDVYKSVKNQVGEEDEQ